MSPKGGDIRVSAVQPAFGYNSWPMIQAVGGKVVCAYSKGTAHNIGEGPRGVYAKTSVDGGKTWGEEVCVANDPSVGEVTIGKGLDNNGAMLLWVRRWGRTKGHDLYRTTDGKTFERISSPKFSPMPMQVTDVFKVPGVGLMSLWFSGKYAKEEDEHYWGTLTSADNGRTWKQRTIGDNVAKRDWPTEQSAVCLGDGRILAIARSEGGDKPQFQLTSTDGGATWRCCRTNIRDVFMSTPSLIYDPDTGLVANYYYHRGANLLKRRVVDAKAIFDHPGEWPEPEVLAEGGERGAAHAGNVNAVRIGNRDLLALYSGTKQNCIVFVVTVPKPTSTFVHNPGFENGAAHWRVPHPTWRIEDGAGRGGGKGLVWENSDPQAYSFPAQRVALEGGGVYRFGCWVKIDSVQKDGKRIKPSISLDWSDANGKWLSAAYARPAVGNETGTDGWVRFEGVTSPLPDVATHGSLLCFLPKGATGKARFDDFSLKPEAVRMVDWLCSSAYRDTATGGSVSFHASLYINLVRHPLCSIEPRFSYEAADGTTVLAAPDIMSPQSASITIPVSAMANGRQKVAFTLCDKQGGEELGRAECMFTRTSKFSPRVMFDGHKRTLVDGRPFLPLGMYAHRLDADTLASYTNGVFNCIMLYGATRDQLDLAQAAGLKVIYSVKDVVWGSSHVRRGCETREKSLAAIREAVVAAKNHPALLAWYVNDESPESQIGALREVNALIHELDPDHPTWAVTDKPWQARAFLGTYDCLGMDPYPIGNSRGGIEIAAEWALEARRGFFDIMPMWHVPQAFNWKWYRGTVQNPEHRFPTREELASMYWQAIAAGSNGLVPYAFHSMCKFMDEKEFDKAMGDVVAVMSAIKRRETVILSDPGPSAKTDAKNLFCRTWTAANGERWILLSNANRERISATVKLGDGFVGVVTDDGVVATLTAPDTLSVELGPLASGFARLTPSASADIAEALLTRWCDAMVAHQLDFPCDNGLDGGMVCSACARLHGRIGDAVYPLVVQWSRSGDAKYLTAARKAIDWCEANMLCSGGEYQNDLMSPWTYITVFSHIAIGRTLRQFGNGLPHDFRAQLESIYARQSKWLYDNLSDPRTRKGGINYLCSYAEAMAEAGHDLKEPKYLEEAKKAVVEIREFIAKDGLLTGEVVPLKFRTSERNLDAVDIGYNLEEAIPAMMATAEELGDESFDSEVVATAKAHLEFMLPDGAIDNSAGSRASKWTYSGSRTADGVLPLLAMLEKRGVKWARRAAERVVALHARLTGDDGLLHGGLYYRDAGEPACLHHTFTHAKALAEYVVMTADSPRCADDEPMPRERRDRVVDFPTMDVKLASVGPWRATFSASDATLFPNQARKMSTGGGSPTLLWHEKAGLMLAATQADFFFVEPTNQQETRKERAILSTTPRLETADGFTNVQDFGVKVKSTFENGAFSYSAEGALTSLKGEKGAAFSLGYRLNKSGFSIRAKAAAPCRYYLPVVGGGDTKISVSGNEATIERGGVRFLVKSSLPLKVRRTERGERSFTTIGGIMSEHLYAELDAETELRLGLEI